MNIALALLATCLHIFLCSVIAPLLWGIVDQLCARMQGRRGVSFKQPYRHLAKLLGKTTLIPDTATDLFSAWPLLACLIFAVVVMLIPGFCTGLLTARASDYVTIIGLFMLGRAAMMLAGFETGSALGGAAIARRALFSLFTEAILLVLLLSFAFFAQSTGIDEIAVTFAHLHAGFEVALVFALVSMLIVAAMSITYRTEAGQDLAMLEEAMALEYSGRFLALLDYAKMLQLLAWMNLMICLFLPFGMAKAQAILSWPEGLALWILKLLGLAMGLAVFAVINVEMRLRRVPVITGVALFLSLLGSVLVFAVMRVAA